MDTQDEPRAESGPDDIDHEHESEISSNEPAPVQNDESHSVDNPNLNLAKIRDLIILAHEDVVPELVVGETFDDLLASIEPARQAFQQVVERIIRPASTAAHIPAGQPGRSATHDSQATSLNPGAKIAEGLRRRTG